MSDLETMPAGSANAMREAAELLRVHEEHFRDVAESMDASRGAGTAAVKAARLEVADTAGTVAGRLEALLDACPHAPPGVRNPIFQRRT